MLAYLVDLVIQIAYFIIVAFILLDNIFNNPDYSTSIALLLIALPIMFYSVCESTMEGKLWQKIIKNKVVKNRWLSGWIFDYFGTLDFLQLSIFKWVYSGVIAMVSTKHTQRLGFGRHCSDLRKIKIQYKSYYTYGNYWRLQTLIFSRNQMILFSDNDIRIIKEKIWTYQQIEKCCTSKKIAEKNIRCH